MTQGQISTRTDTYLAKGFSLDLAIAMAVQPEQPVPSWHDVACGDGIYRIGA